MVGVQMCCPQKLNNAFLAAVCWLASLCFSEAFMDALARKLVAEAPSLRVIASLAAFPG